MNKTVNINLSGIIFHIEEDAYQKLHSYLNKIRSYFSESQGRDEIMADIENRIAELLSEKVSDRKQVVLMSDVNQVISQMGQPEDFAAETAEDKAAPTSTYAGSSNRKRRVFRDPDNKILGGVCGGIAAYFNVDPLWLRLALAISFFFFGTGFLLYIILWMIIPQAKTPSEKLEMSGEEVNFSNIGKKVEEEMSAFGKRVEEWGGEVKNNNATRQAGSFFGKLIGLIGTLIGGALRVIVKIFGFFLTLIGLIILVAMISSLFAGSGFIHLDGETFSLQEGFNMFFTDPGQMRMAGIAMLLFFGVPLMLLVYAGVKMLLGIRNRNRYVLLGAGVLWIIGLILMIVSTKQVADQFTEDESVRVTVPVTQPSNGIMYLKMQRENDNFSTAHHDRKRRGRIRFNHHDMIDTDDKNLYLGYPEMNIVKSETDSFEVVIYQSSSGADRQEALRLANNIMYDITQKDSVLEFSPNFSVSKSDKWRDQQIQIELRVPKGKMIYLSNNMKRIIYDIKNETNTWDSDMVNRRWIMGNQELRCIDCEGLEGGKRKKWKINVDEVVIEDSNSTAPALPPPPAPPKAPAPAKEKVQTVDTIQ